MKKGFTLVELSITLVIIGLLIGGILVGQSMIRTARIIIFIRQISLYDAAVENFKSKYNGLPGDSSIMGCVNTASTTCDNGFIEIQTGAPFAFVAEVASFWSNLSASGLSNENGSAFSSTMSGSYPLAGINIPAAKISNTAGIIAAAAGSSNPFYNAYNISQFNSSGGSHGVIPADALAVDVKIDNGIHGTGNVIIGTNNSFGVYITNGSPDGVCRIISSGELNLATTTEACGMNIRMGISTGDFQ